MLGSFKSKNSETGRVRAGNLTAMQEGIFRAVIQASETSLGTYILRVPIHLEGSNGTSVSTLMTEVMKKIDVVVECWAVTCRHVVTCSCSDMCRS